MSKIINFSEIKSSLNSKKKVVKLSFVKNFDDELYLEDSTTKDNVLSVNLQHFGTHSETPPLTANECPFEGGYFFRIGGKDIFLNYAESLDLYVLLNGIFKSADNVKNIETIMEE